MPVRGIRASDLTVTDYAGRSLFAYDTLVPDLHLDGNFIVFPKETKSISYRVDLDPAHSGRFGLPMPGIGEHTDLIDGAYFFLLPLVGTDFAAQWRTPVDIRLEFVPSSGRTLVGTDAKVSFRTNYELMFVRAVFDPKTKSTFTMRNHEVTTYTTASDSVKVPEFNPLLEKCIRLVEDSLLVLPTYRYFVGENPVFWGVEGSQGYWFRPETQTSPAVHVHELVHTFVGIYNGDQDDPWYKEGMTDYLGNLLPLQAGLIKDSAFIADMLWARDTIQSIQHYALSSPYVRNHLFVPLDTAFKDQPDPENFIQLVYGKGAQASMILDRYILERSGGRYSVFNLVRDLNHKGPSFHRRDLVSLVSEYTGADATAFLESLLDKVAPLPKDSLDRTYAALKQMGRFAPGFPPGAVASPKSATGSISGFGMHPKSEKL